MSKELTIDKPLPGEIEDTIRWIVAKHYDNLKQPKPNYVAREIYTYLCPYLKWAEPDFSKPPSE